MAFETTDTQAEYQAVRGFLKSAHDAHLAMLGVLKILERQPNRTVEEQAIMDEISVRLGFRFEGPGANSVTFEDASAGIMRVLAHLRDEPQ